MLLATFLIIFSAIALRDIRHGIYLVVFSMPLYLWRFSILNIPTTALEIMIYILFLAWIINKLGFALNEGEQMFVRLRLKRTLKFLSDKLQRYRLAYETIKSVSYRKLFRENNFVLNIGIILLFLGAGISTSISSDTRTSLGIFKGWFFDPFLFFIVFINIIKTKREIYLVLKSWLVSGAAVSLIGIFYLLNNDLTFDGRLRAFFLSPNHLAMYISMPFLIAVWFLLETGNRKPNPLLSKEGRGWLKCWRLVSQITNYKLPITALIIITIPLYFTLSYGAFLGIFAGTLYLIIKNKALKIKNIYWLGFVILLFFGFVFLSSSKFSQIINSSNRSSFHSRLMIWNSAGEIMEDNPLFGIGPGTFQETYLSDADKFSEPYLEWAVPQPHNIFLAFYLQTGLIGFAGFILVLFWFFQSRRHYMLSRRHVDVSPSRDNKNNIPISNIQYPNILISLMIYTLVHGLVDTTYWKNDLALMFWLIIGLGLITFEMSRPASYNKDRGNLKTK